MEKNNPQLQDLAQYASKFTQSAFVEKIGKVAKRAGAKLVYAALVLYYSLQSDSISTKDKALIIGALGYLIAPLDLVPDAIPIAGLTDDLAALRYVLVKVLVNVPEDVKNKATETLNKWFDPEEIEKVEEESDGTDLI